MDPQSNNPENQNNDPTNLDLPEQPAAPAMPRTEEELFQSANHNMQLDQAPPSQPLPVKKSKKKLVLIILVLLVLIGGGAAAWLLTQNSSDNTAEVPAETAEQVVQKTYEPNTIPYAFREQATQPVTLYSRPAIGGERKEIQQLTRDTIVSYSDTNGSNVLVVADEDILVSTDHGAGYKKVFESEAGAQITSIKFSAEGDGIVFGYLKTAGGKNEIRTMNLEGQDVKTVTTSDEAGVFIEGWSTKNNQLVYQSGCYNCGGGARTVYAFDTKESKRKTLLENVAKNRVYSLAVSDDTKLLLYVTGTFKEAEGEILPPYNVTLLTIADNEEKSVATIGTAGEKNPNGTDKLRLFKTGFTDGPNTPYYTVDQQLYLVRNNEPLLFYESDKSILQVNYVSDKYVIAQSGTIEDFALTNYEVSTKKATAILQGDGNTRIFGVTTD